MRLNLGCGRKHLDGYVNLDISPKVGADIVHDLDIAPWPFDDNSADEIIAENIFEHVSDPILFMAECHRILKTDGILKIYVPHYTSPDAFTDPTHKRYCTDHTFDFWIKGTLYYNETGETYGGWDHPFNLELDVNRAMQVVLKKLEPDFRETQ